MDRWAKFKFTLTWIIALTMASAYSSTYRFYYFTVYDGNALSPVREFSGPFRAQDGAYSFWTTFAGTDQYIIQRIDLPFTPQAIRLYTRLDTYSILNTGDGYGSFSVSRDGQTWVKILDAPVPRTSGSSATYIYDKLLPESVLGTTTLYTKTIFNVALKRGISDAEKLRFIKWGASDETSPKPIFSVEATLPDPPPTASPIPSPLPSPTPRGTPAEYKKLKLLVKQYRLLHRQWIEAKHISNEVLREKTVQSISIRMRKLQQRVNRAQDATES